MNTCVHSCLAERVNLVGSRHLRSPLNRVDLWQNIGWDDESQRFHIQEMLVGIEGKHLLQATELSKVIQLPLPKDASLTLLMGYHQHCHSDNLWFVIIGRRQTFLNAFCENKRSRDTSRCLQHTSVCISALELCRCFSTTSGWRVSRDCGCEQDDTSFI